MNIHSINLLKYSAFSAGIIYGYTHLNSLSLLVKERSLLKSKSEYEELVEEAKISFDTFKTSELAKLAKLDNSKILC